MRSVISLSVRSPHRTCRIHGPPQAERILSLDGLVCGMVWKPSGDLVVVTETEVIEWPSNRRVPASLKLEHPLSRLRMVLSFDGTQAFGDGFVLDLKNLSTRSLKGGPVWVGNDIGEIEIADEDGTGCTLTIKGKSRRLFNGHFLLGVSPFGDHALVAPTNGSGDIHLVSLNPLTGGHLRLFTFPKAWDDQSLFREASYNSGLGQWLINAKHTAAAFYRPLLESPELTEVRFPPLKTAEQTSAHLEWVRSGSPWTIAQRQFFYENGSTAMGYDASSLSLYNVRTHSIRLLATLTNWWPFDDDQARARSRFLGYALDMKRLRLTYVTLHGNRSVISLVRFRALMGP